MALILNIETSTPVCSVSLAENNNILALRESSEEKSHAGNLPVFIEEVLTEQQKSLRDLDAVAVGKGPGSYTGLRIGVAIAKGITYGANIPLIAISSFETMVAYALQKMAKNQNIPNPGRDAFLCPMIDARRMEVYMAFFDCTGNRVQADSAVIIDSNTFAAVSREHPVILFGTGAMKCRGIVNHENVHWIEGIYPSAGAMALKSYAKFSEQLFEDIAYFEPYYLKDFVTTKSRKNILQRPIN
jgi:tRNA threonylcarbamoyladenosine biosynthesis protein TsaB